MTAYERRIRDGRFPRTREGLGALMSAAGLGDVRTEALARDHQVGAEDWWAGPASGVGAIEQLVNSRGPEGVATAKREYDVLRRIRQGGRRVGSAACGVAGSGERVAAAGPRSHVW
ncbi:hypothetical protein ACFRCW_43470 [Streptomyces sp. NPDC056653]|uniref:hypothetical protein n=1 Tax=Streptomyces sp. NPDC056653 TaxID=3345894 RepID=UPI0036B324B7